MLTVNTILARGLRTTVDAVERARRRVRRVVRRYAGRVSPGQLVDLVRAELARTEPVVARSVEAGVLAAWVAAARRPARDAGVPESEGLAELPPALPPGPPFGPLWLVNEPEQPAVRWPAVEAAARDLLSRRVVTADEYADLTDDARRSAFAVARALSAAGTLAVRDAVAQAVMYGGGLREFRQNVGAVLDAAGLRPDQVEQIYRTQTGLARAAGMQKVLDHPLVAGEFPYLAYHAIHDGRVRPDHLAMETNGIQGTNIYRADDPVIRRLWPPWGYNCRCHLTPFTVEDAAAAGVAEAREWARTNVPPARPAFVQDPGYRLPKDWPARDGRVHPAIGA
jgi:SPP1 gp7 family putative phage head morphogenesis protein